MIIFFFLRLLLLQLELVELRQLRCAAKQNRSIRKFPTTSSVVIGFQTGDVTASFPRFLGLVCVGSVCVCVWVYREGWRNQIHTKPKYF